MKATLLPGFFACLFLVRSPQNKPKQLYYVAQFPMTSPPKKNYIYIYYSNYIILYYIISYYISYYIMYIYIYIILYYVTYIYIYIYLFIFFAADFPATSRPKKLTYLFNFSAASPPLPTEKKNKHTFCSFFCHRFARGQPSKKYKFEKNTTYIYIYKNINIVSGFFFR